MSLESADINDVFDEIAFSEDKIVQEGFCEGLKKGIKEAEEEGYHLGFHKGIEFGYELGYYGGVVKYFLSSHESKEFEVSDKIFHILVKLDALISSYPPTNCSNTDILQLKSEIKSLFRRLCSLLKFDGLLAEKGVSF